MCPQYNYLPHTHDQSLLEREKHSNFRADQYLDEHRRDDIRLLGKPGFSIALCSNAKRRHFEKETYI